ncbi:MAG: flagellar hook-length control protein FliK [Gammaproteobacteria bacterium]|nr:flagellar hook-length control protein FliK [Gammaproteobacteria bacterium]
MEIPGSQGISSNAATQALAALDFFKQLTRVGPMLARVSVVNQGQAVLLTQLGQVTTANALDLKKGDQIQIRAGGSEQHPVLKISQPPPRPTTLNSVSHPSLSKQIPTDRAVTAFIVGQQAATSKIQLGNRQFDIPHQQNLNIGKLISLTRQPGKNIIEIRPVDHQQVLKSTISRLLPYQTTSQPMSGLTQLVKLVQNYTSTLRPTTGEPPPMQGKIPVSTEDIGNIRPIPPSKNTVRPSNPLQTLLETIPSLARFDKAVLQQWISRLVLTTNNTLRVDKALPETEQLLQLLPKTESSMVKMLQQLTQQILSQPLKPGVPPAPDIRPQFDEQLQMLARDMIKLVDQSTGQQLLQHTSLRYQQELQQPMSFNLAIPMTVEQKTRELQLKIHQRHQPGDRHKQCWDIHFNFEFGLLGMISTHLQLDETTLSASFWSELTETQNKIENNLPGFRQQLVSVGLEPGSLRSFKGSPPATTEPSSPVIPESLLDIRV